MQNDFGVLIQKIVVLVLRTISDDVDACYDTHVQETDFGCGVTSPSPERFLVGIMYPYRMVLEF